MFNIFVKYRIFLFNLKTLKFYSFDGSPVLIPVWNINTRYSTCACVLWNWNWEILNFKLKVYSVSVIGDVQLRKRFPGNAQSPVQILTEGYFSDSRGTTIRLGGDSSDLAVVGEVSDNHADIRSSAKNWNQESAMYMYLSPSIIPLRFAWTLGT